MSARYGLLKVSKFPFFQRSFAEGVQIVNEPNKPTPPPPPAAAPVVKAPEVADVPGLSAAVIEQHSDPVGPGAAKSTDYKNPEYFCYNRLSYFEAEIEMSKYRCPQPSALKQ